MGGSTHSILRLHTVALVLRSRSYIRTHDCFRWLLNIIPASLGVWILCDSERTAPPQRKVRKMGIPAWKGDAATGSWGSVIA